MATALAWLRTGAFNVLFYGVTFVLLALAIPTMYVSPRRLGTLAHAWSDWHRFCVTHILGIDVIVEGEKPAGQAVYAIRHESYFEAIDIPHFVGGAPIPFAKAELRKVPLWGPSAQRYGVISVERGRGASALKAMARAATAARKSNRSFAIFPEGTRVKPGQTRKLGAGTYAIYKILALPLVPVAVASAHVYAARPKRRGTIHYRIAEVVPPGLERDEFEARVFAAINALNPVDQSSDALPPA